MNARSFALLLATTLPSLAAAAEININPGDDLVTLTSALGPGDEVLISEGTYTITQTIEWTGAGTANQPIVIRAVNGQPVIEIAEGVSPGIRIEGASHLEVRGLLVRGADAHYDANRFTGIDIYDSSHVTLQGVNIAHVGGTGLYVGGESSDLAFTRVKVRDTRDGHGIYLGCDDASCVTSNSVIESSWVSDIKGDYRYGIFVANGSFGNRVADNVVYDISYRGLSVGSTEFSESNDVDGNVVWNTGLTNSGACLRVAGAATVRNNIAFNCVGNGLRAENNSRDTLEKSVISHNTFYGTTDWGVDITDWAGRDGMVFANNAVTNTTARAFRARDGAIDEANYFSGNVISGLVEGLAADSGAYVPGAGEADYADPANWDFYPGAGSVLPFSGDPSGDAWVPARDFNGLDRDGANPTVGAYEFVALDNPGWEIREDFKQLTTSIPVGDEEIGGCCNKDESSEAGLYLLPLALLFTRRRRD